MPNPKVSKNKNRKDININFYNFNNLLLAYFNKYNSFNKNLLKINNVIDNTFFNDKDEKKLIISKKVKYILFKDIIKAIKLYFENLKIKNMALFHKMKNMIELK